MSTYLYAAVKLGDAGTGAFTGRTLGISGTAALPAASVYTFTLQPRWDATDVVAFATVTGATAGFAAPAAVVTDTTLAVSTFSTADAITPLNLAFHLAIFGRKPLFTGGNGGIGRLAAHVKVGTAATGAFTGKTYNVTGTAAAPAGTSVYTINLATPIAVADRVSIVTLRDATSGTVRISSATDSTVVVTTSDEDGVLATRAFDLQVWRCGIGP